MLPNDLLVKDELKKLAKEREGFYFLAPTHKCSEFQRVVGEPNFTLIGLDNLRGYYFLNQANGGRESVNIKGYLQNGTHYDLILPLEDNRLNFVLSPQTNKNNKKFIDEGLPCLFSELCELNCKLSRSSLAVRLQSSRTDIEFIISRKTSGFSIHFFLRGEYGGHKRFLEFSVRSDIATQVEVSVNAEKNKVFALENERITPFEDFKRVSVYPVHRVSENHIQIVGKKIIRDFNDDYSDLSKSCFSEIVPNDEFTELGAFTSFRDWICDENGFSSLVYYVPENTMLSLGREISIADTTKYHPDEMSSFSQDLIWGNVLISENQEIQRMGYNYQRLVWCLCFLQMLCANAIANDFRVGKSKLSLIIVDSHRGCNSSNGELRCLEYRSESFSKALEFAKIQAQQSSSNRHMFFIGSGANDNTSYALFADKAKACFKGGLCSAESHFGDYSFSSIKKQSNNAKLDWFSEKSFEFFFAKVDVKTSYSQIFPAVLYQPSYRLETLRFKQTLNDYTVTSRTSVTKENQVYLNSQLQQLLPIMLQASMKSDLLEASTLLEFDVYLVTDDDKNYIPASDTPLYILNELEEFEFNAAAQKVTNSYNNNASRPELSEELKKNTARIYKWVFSRAVVFATNEQPRLSTNEPFKTFEIPHVAPHYEAGRFKIAKVWQECQRKGRDSTEVVCSISDEQINKLKENGEAEVYYETKHKRKGLKKAVGTFKVHIEGVSSTSMHFPPNKRPYIPIPQGSIMGNNIRLSSPDGQYNEECMMQNGHCVLPWAMPLTNGNYALQTMDKTMNLYKNRNDVRVSLLTWHENRFFGSELDSYGNLPVTVNSNTKKVCNRYGEEVYNFIIPIANGRYFLKDNCENAQTYSIIDIKLNTFQRYQIVFITILLTIILIVLIRKLLFSNSKVALRQLALATQMPRITEIE